MRYRELVLLHSVRFAPGWKPNNEMVLPYAERFKAPEFTISREPGEHAYLVTHGESGERVEVPLHNAKWAVLEPLPPPAPKPEVVSARRGK